MRRLTIFIGIMALALGSVACGSSDSSSSSSDSSSSSSSSSGGSSISVGLGALVFLPDSISASAGEITLDVTNEDGTAHNLIVEELGVDSGILDPAGTASLTFTAAAGSYSIICNIPGHSEAGMVGTLTVT